MQQRPNSRRPVSDNTRPTSSRRPANGQRPAPRRRPMTPREYEMLQRRRRQQNLRYMAMLGAFAVVLIVAVVLILKPRPGRDAVQTAAVVTVAPDAAATAQAGGVNLDDPRDESAVSATATAAVETPLPTVTAVPTPRPGGLRSARMRVIGDVMVCESQDRKSVV